MLLKNAPRVQPCAKSGQTYFNRKHIKNQYLVSGHPTGASGIEFHYKGPDISYLLNTEEERKLNGSSEFPYNISEQIKSSSKLETSMLRISER